MEEMFYRILGASIRDARKREVFLNNRWLIDCKRQDHALLTGNKEEEISTLLKY